MQSSQSRHPPSASLAPASLAPASLARPRTCIVGFGRAGKIHLEHATDLLDVVRVVDKRASLQTLELAARVDDDLESALRDEEIEAIIVATPTSTHHAICKRALEHGKHVFVEKPLACNVREIEELYALAHERRRVLFTALNRRYDPEWLGLRDAVAGKAPLYGNVVCRDYPFPPAAYLEACGGIFRDAAVHDIDMLCHVLDDTPVLVHADTDERRETSSVILTFSRGCRIHMVHSRHSSHYDQRVQLFCDAECFEFGGEPAERAARRSFAERYRESYVDQLRAFRERVVTRDPTPNVELQHALLLERVLDACDASAESGEPVSLKTLRAYEAAKLRVRDLYKRARQFHTVTTTKRLLDKYAPGACCGGRRVGVWEMYDMLDGFVDLSDPDVDVPNTQHALQTAESIRRANLPDWLQLIGLIHDFGKVLYRYGCDADGTSLETQWSLVGDTFVVGCPLPDELVYPEFNRLRVLSADEAAPHGVYAPGCGLENVHVSFGHDEWLYRVLRASRTNLPDVALRIVRYHSLYAWHQDDAYAALESDEDRLAKGWVKLFNAHDLYSKRARPIALEHVRAHYAAIVDKYLPDGLLI